MKAMTRPWTLLACEIVAAACALIPARTAAAGFSTNANRLTYLDRADPFYAGLDFPKLTTPQWVGENGVDEVIIFGVDDMSDPPKYERFLRPLLNRLKQIDGRAPVSIFSTSPNPTNSLLPQWLEEGLTFEVHTLSHPCPILGGNDFSRAVSNYFGCLDLLNSIPGNTPVAFRTPCCDSIDSASPRLMAELLCGRSPKGNFLQMDSSVVMLLTTNDPALPASVLASPEGSDSPGRFTKYVPFKSFTTTIENYPYPFVIDHLLWEMPFPAPSDWESHNIQGDVSPRLTEDWKAAIDLIAQKQGAFTFVFHPHGWSSSAQMVDLVDYANRKYGKRIKFLNFKEALERLNKNLLAGQPLRAAHGEDNGVRLLDLNNDGYLDLVIGNPALRKTRVWNPAARDWIESSFPVSIVKEDRTGSLGPTQVHFGIVRPGGFPSVFMLGTTDREAWTFDGKDWNKDADLLNGLEIGGDKVLSAREGHDNGVRLRDIDGDGVCELIVSNEAQNKIFKWDGGRREWAPMSFALPAGASIVNEKGEDNGLRFVDLNEDGLDDVIYSNEKVYGIYLYVAEPFLGFGTGWTRKVTDGRRGDENAIPAFVREGSHRNNGAWFHSRHLWVQNENTAKLPDLVDRRSFDELLIGVMPPPKSPEASAALLKVPPGFKAEVAVSEPLVESPIAFDWDAQGRLWVVEMRDYPLGMDGKGKPGGVIKVLEDSDGDGRYDKATVFLKDLNFPTGLMCWRNGVLISAAPDILYAEDTNGDGVADTKKVLMTGFREGNQQHRVNGFELGLDGWVYGANGDSGGEIRVLTGVMSAPNAAAATPLKAVDFRFDPDTGAFEAIEGETQFGRHRDDWGNWFGNANYTWLWQYKFPVHYLARNPYLAVRDMRMLLARYDGAGHVYPISRPQQRPNAVGEENHVTSANSATPYRDDLFGPDFATTVFISEPSENLVHREVLSRGAGSVPQSARASGDEHSEFLASADNYFRPAQMKTGPDGALYIADMYRGTIEHPEWIPHDLQAHVNLRAGEGKGRIYRVYPADKKLRPIPNLQRLALPELLAAMNSPNGWQRDTVMRLLIERHQTTDARALERIATSSANPKARLQALCTLGLLDALSPDLLLTALKDEHPAVRKQAIRLSEPFLRRENAPPDLLNALLALTGDQASSVALQLALTLGETKDARAAEALVSLAENHANDEVIQQAILSSALPHYARMIDRLAAQPASPPAALIEHLLTLALAGENHEALERGVALTLKLHGKGGEEIQFNAAAGLLKLIERKPGAAAQRGALLRDLRPISEHARAVAFDPAAESGRRIAAINTLRMDSAGSSVEQLGELLSPRQPLEIQRAGLELFKHLHQPAAAKLILEQWASFSPALRANALDVLLANNVSTEQLLAALESGAVALHDINTIAKQRLLKNSNSEIRARVEKLFTKVRTDRAAVLADYERVRAMKGDAERGRAQFTLNCAPCHRLQGIGFSVGPDLASMGDKSANALLPAILDPNRTVLDQFINYTVTAKNGSESSGIIASESPNSITLRGPNGFEETLLRSDIAKLASTRLSLMPEGFENSINPSQMADLIAFVGSSSAPPKSFPGNSPAVVSPDATGALHLTAGRAEIYGSSLVFEKDHQNLGWWQNENDHAIWTIEIPAAGDFEISVNYANAGRSGANRARIEAADASFENSVPGTGSWDTYKRASWGTLHLETGSHRLLIRSVPPVSEAIMDLREITLTPAGAEARRANR